MHIAANVNSTLNSMHIAANVNSTLNSMHIAANVNSILKSIYIAANLFSSTLKMGMDILPSLFKAAFSKKSRRYTRIPLADHLMGLTALNGSST